MFLSGPDARRPGSFAVEQIAALLTSKLSLAPYDSKFQPFGGVIVAGDWASATEALRSRRPVLVLEMADCREDGEAVYNVGRRLLIEISVEVATGAFCAGAEGPLKDALFDIIEQNIEFLESLALEEAEIQAGQGKNEVPGRINPHTISLAVHTN